MQRPHSCSCLSSAAPAPLRPGGVTAAPTSGSTGAQIDATTTTTAATATAAAVSPTSTITAPTTATSAAQTSLSQSNTSDILIPTGVGDNESLNFEPSRILVIVGVNNTIVWKDTDYVQHTVVSVSVPQGAAKFNSGILNQGQTFTVTLTVPSDHRYVCSIHPDWMVGSITVVE